MIPEPPAPVVVDPVVVEAPAAPAEPVVEVVAAVVPPLPPANELPRPDASAPQAATTRIQTRNTSRKVVHSIALCERHAIRARRFARRLDNKHERTSRST